LARWIPLRANVWGPAAFLAACRAAITGEIPTPKILAPVVGDRALAWTGSGSQALSLILVALKMGRGAKVAVPLLSPPAVAAAVKAAGCEPLFIDVDPRTLVVDPNEVARVRSRVSAIVAVHLFGNVADMDRVMEYARGVPVIEDTAQCLTGVWRGRRAGTFGVASFYSFGAIKCVAAGAGGLAAVNGSALAADVRDLARKLLVRKRFESLRAVFHSAAAGSVATTTVDARAVPPPAAAAVAVMVDRFAERAGRRRANSLRLCEILRGSGAVLPVEPPGALFSYAQFPVLLASAAERDEVRRILLEHSVESSPVMQDCAALAAPHGYRGSCPVSEHAAERLLILPNHAALSTNDVERVGAAFNDSHKRARAAGRVRKIFEARAV
jgi:dTDP-4-amino-4,6-dideoxygalactose transaminase